jgi:hypothetical protein
VVPGQNSLPLSGWVNFYVIVGSSAGALTGLQFVVITLIAELRTPGTMQDVRAFGTPTVVHFCAALLISAIMSAPWPSVSHLDFCIAACGIAGIVYALRVLWHAYKAPYNPDAEDWLWFGVFPLIAYAVLAVVAVLLRWHATSSLFLIAGTTLFLLFIGIHNAWDTVTFIAFQHRASQEKEGRNGHS